MSIPQLARDEWSKHPRFPAQALLLGSHDAFRRHSDWIITRVASLDPLDSDQYRRRQRWLLRMSTEFEWWMSGMRGHERYEETKLYPYLAHRYGASFARLEQGHHELSVHKEIIRRAFRISLDPCPDDPSPQRKASPAVMSTRAQADAALLEALHTHRVVLLDHLRDEEDFVIPMLLAMSPTEFEYFYQTSPPELKRRMESST